MIKILIVNILLVLLSLNVTSCKPVYEKVINDVYYQEDTVHICDFLIFNRIQVGAYKSEYYSVENFSDSIINVFNQSFLRLNINYKIHNSKNAVDSSFIENKYKGSYHYPPTKLIIDIANKCNKNIVLVPLIEVHHGGVGAEAGLTYYDRGYFTAFIVKENKIIYAHDNIVKSEIFQTTLRSERPFDLLKEDDWDELVRGAMQPYIERLE